MDVQLNVHTKAKPNKKAESEESAFVFFAERVGFEPTVPLRIHYLSRVANSTTLASLQLFKYPNLLAHFQIIG
jgi:hypothetical protein